MTALMPDTFRDWLELVGPVFGAGVIVLVGWAVWHGIGLLVDWRRSTRPSRPVGEVAPAVSEPATIPAAPRSPFAPGASRGARESGKAAAE